MPCRCVSACVCVCVCWVLPGIYVARKAREEKDECGCKEEEEEEEMRLIIATARHPHGADGPHQQNHLCR